MKKLLDTPPYLINDFVNEMLQKNSFTVFGVGGVVGLEFWEYPRDPDQTHSDILYTGVIPFYPDHPSRSNDLPPLYLVKFSFSKSGPYFVSGINSTCLPNSVATLSEQKAELENLKTLRYADLDEQILNGW